MRSFGATLGLCAWALLACGEASAPGDDAGIDGGDLLPDVGAVRQSEGSGCNENGECAAGLFCQFKYPSSECAQPKGGIEGGWWCGRCTRPGTAVQACVGGDPDEGEPCDEAAMKGYACRHRSCHLYTLKECICSQARWRCSFSPRGCIDFSAADGGVTPAGEPPMCWTRCGVAP